MSELANNVREFLVAHNKKNGWGVTDEKLIEAVLEAKEVWCDEVNEHRWWTEYAYVVKIDNKYLQFLNARATGDMSASERGYEVDPATIQFVEPHEETITTIVYKPCGKGYEMDRKAVDEAIDLLSFWACCFDYSHFTPEIADKCGEAEELLKNLLIIAE